MAEPKDFPKLITELKPALEQCLETVLVLEPIARYRAQLERDLVGIVAFEFENCPNHDDRRKASARIDEHVRELAGRIERAIRQSEYYASVRVLLSEIRQHRSMEQFVWVLQPTLKPWLLTAMDESLMSKDHRDLIRALGSSR